MLRIRTVSCRDARIRICIGNKQPEAARLRQEPQKSQPGEIRRWEVASAEPGDIPPGKRRAATQAHRPPEGAAQRTPHVEWLPAGCSFACTFGRPCGRLGGRRASAWPCSLDQYQPCRAWPWSGCRCRLASVHTRTPSSYPEKSGQQRAGGGQGFVAWQVQITHSDPIFQWRFNGQVRALAFGAILPS